jgi:hypothetical protein
MLLRRFCSRLRFRNHLCNCSKKFGRSHPLGENQVGIFGIGRNLLQTCVHNDGDFGLEPLHLGSESAPGKAGKQLVCDDKVNMIEGEQAHGRFTVGCSQHLVTGNRQNDLTQH